MPYRERLGPRIQIGPLGLGNRLGREVRRDEILWYSEDGDSFGECDYGVRVTGSATAQTEVHADFHGGVIQEYAGKKINHSPAKGVIRFV